MIIFIYSITSLTVIASFRGTVPYGLSLEIGDTVQILEKCDGKWANEIAWGCMTNLLTIGLSFCWFLGFFQWSQWAIFDKAYFLHLQCLAYGRASFAVFKLIHFPWHYFLIFTRSHHRKHLRLLYLWEFMTPCQTRRPFSESQGSSRSPRTGRNRGPEQKWLLQV